MIQLLQRLRRKRHFIKPKKQKGSCLNDAFLILNYRQENKSFWHFGTKVINIMVCSSVLLLCIEGHVNNLADYLNHSLNCTLGMTQPSLSYHMGIRQKTNSGESYISTISLPVGFQLVCSYVIGFDLTLTDETLWIGLEQKIWHWCNSHRRESLANNISSHSRRHLRMFPRDLTHKSCWILLWQIKALLLPAAHPNPARDCYPVAESIEGNTWHIWRAWTTVMD